MTPEISVVVPFHGPEEALLKCLSALSGQTVRSRMQVVVSVDGPEMPERAGNLADLMVSTGEKKGPAAARNLGWRRSSGSIILFTDSDCEPEPDWAERMAEPLRSGFSASKGVYTRGGSAPVQRLAQIEFEERYRIIAKAGRVTMADTYSAGFTREMLERTGGFDESFPVPDHEDVDLSWRLLDAGGTICFVPAAGVAHTHRSRWSAYFMLKMSRGRWRLRVLADFPGMALADGYTPQAMKLQMVLAPLLIPAMAAAWFRPAILLLWLGLFLALSLPMMIVAAGTDPGMLPLVPVFAWWRGMALTAGVVKGLTRGGRSCSRL